MTPRTAPDHTQPMSHEDPQGPDTRCLASVDGPNGRERCNNTVATVATVGDLFCAGCRCRYDSPPSARVTPPRSGAPDLTLQAPIEAARLIQVGRKEFEAKLDDLTARLEHLANEDRRTLERRKGRDRRTSTIK